MIGTLGRILIGWAFAGAVMLLCLALTEVMRYEMLVGYPIRAALRERTLEGSQCRLDQAIRNATRYGYGTKAWRTDLKYIRAASADADLDAVAEVFDASPPFIWSRPCREWYINGIAAVIATTIVGFCLWTLGFIIGERNVVIIRTARG